MIAVIIIIRLKFKSIKKLVNKKKISNVINNKSHYHNDNDSQNN